MDLRRVRIVTDWTLLFAGLRHRQFRHLLNSYNNKIWMLLDVGLVNNSTARLRCNWIEPELRCI